LDFYLYIDEFHNLVTETFENLLSEARKFGICLTMAHQYMSQLLPGVQGAILGNVGSIIVFRVGGEDAVKLKPEMDPIFDVQDMTKLGMQEFYIKMTIDGETYNPFSAQTLKILPPPHRSFKDEIIKYSRENYTILASEAKKLIADEEALILRSAQEKSAIEGKKTAVAGGGAGAKEEQGAEPMV